MWEFFEAGGPVMWPLLLCSVIALAIILERLWFWMRIDLDKHKGDIEALLRDIQEGDESVASREGAGLIFRMLTTGAAYQGGTTAKAMEIIAIEAMKSMRRGMTVLDTIITIAPMLGIIGTVLGIIASFDMLGQAGVEDPKAVVSGIASALITTATGLSISVATVFPYNYFNSRIDEAQDRLEAYSSRLEVAKDTRVATSGKVAEA